ncbi:thioredoxin family protein [Flammeovirga aprica]|uniref:Thioredoxin family protein n=1 Tax=Flammeovirga aprica JL-4 TaxID=694437 RepID=A0A7X9XBY0_9BACT|nr:thioredoxin family protein [Flammeovirga aprica]NME71173.1 thioredoxin family protein [Flammeovirga aprica JL-4]
MRKLNLTFLFTVLTFTLHAQGIQFSEGTWEEAKVEAKKTNKHLFVDAYTTWCGPCKYLKEKIFPVKEVGDVYNANYISIALDMEKGEGIDFAKKYRVKAFPTLLYFSPDGQIVDQKVGGAKPKEFAQWGKDALDPSKQLFALKRKIESEESPSKERLRNYLLISYESLSPNEKMLSSWLDMLVEEDYNDPENLKLIGKAVTQATIHSKVVAVYQKHSEAVIKALGYGSEKSIDLGLALRTLYDISDTATEEEWEQEKALILKTVERSDVEADMMSEDAKYWISKKEWGKASQSVDKAVMLFDAKNDKYVFELLNDFSWQFYEAGVEAKYMKKALTWANRSVLIKASFYNLDTQAHILYTLGKYEEAKVAAEKAIKHGKRKKNDYSGTQKLLDKINSVL